MHPAEHDHIRIGLLGLVGQPEGIAHEVGNLLDRFVLIIVGEDHGIPFLFEAEDFRAEVEAGGSGGGHGKKGLKSGTAVRRSGIGILEAGAGFLQGGFFGRGQAVHAAAGDFIQDGIHLLDRLSAPEPDRPSV